MEGEFKASHEIEIFANGEKVGKIHSLGVNVKLDQEAELSEPAEMFTREVVVRVDDREWGESPVMSLLKAEELADYDPENLSEEAFKKRYAGLYQKRQPDEKFLSKAAVRGIWRTFMRRERHAFLTAHKNLTVYDIVRVGIDKFIYTMGWKTKADVTRWHNNRVRIGICCHCQDQFIPMMFQTNFGTCNNCRPLFSGGAIRKFVLQQLHISERYKSAHRDAVMDFFIMFYNDVNLRRLFLKGSESAAEYEALDVQLPQLMNTEGIPSLADIIGEGEVGGTEEG